MPEQGGGLSEIRRVLEQEVAHDKERQLRMWVMFDSDSPELGAAHPEATKLSQVCQRIGIPHHMLARRMIENYVPEAAMRAWAVAVQAKVARETNKAKDREASARLRSEVDTYWASPAPERHCQSLKAIAKVARKYDMGTVADIWRKPEYEINASDLDADGWNTERTALFDSLFGSL